MQQPKPVFRKPAAQRFVVTERNQEVRRFAKLADAQAYVVKSDFLGARWAVQDMRPKGAAGAVVPIVWLYKGRGVFNEHRSITLS